MNDIIVAKVTPNGFSSICVIKISGPNLINFIKPIIKKKILNQKVVFAKIYGIKDEIIDSGVVLYFKEPKSFTGEDIIELHIHGSELIYKKIIDSIIFYGAREALPGEFIERRFLNGKISLIESELINNKIYYNNENMFQLTNHSQKNLFLCIIKNSKFRINTMLICMESIGFLEKNPILKDFCFIKKFFKKIKNILNTLLKKIKKIKYLKNIFEIMIIGKRNVGKSTLFNKICMQYDSIVTNIPGTTKNTITKKIYFTSKKFILNDTAGFKIRTKNLIEKIGIMRTINNFYKGNLILYMIDNFNLKEIFYNMPLSFFNKLKCNELIIIVNKCDLLGKTEGIYKINNILIIFLSAKNSVLIFRIKCFISKIIDNENIFNNNEINYSNVKLLFDSCNLFYREFCCNHDIIINKLIKFQKKIFKVTGNYTNKNIRNFFFRNFCIGK